MINSSSSPITGHSGHHGQHSSQGSQGLQGGQDVIFEQAKLLYQQQDHLNAKSLVERLLQDNPQHEEALFMMASIMHQQGKIGTALAQFKKVLELNPDHTDAMVSLSVILNDIGKYQEAKKYFELADSKVKKGNSGLVDEHVNKKFSAHHMEIAQMYATYHRFDECLVEYEKAIRLDPGHLELWVRMAKIYERKGDKQAALNTLLELKAQSPHFIPGLLALGVQYFAQSLLVEAHREWERVLRIDPQNIQAKMYLSMSGNASSAMTSSASSISTL